MSGSMSSLRISSVLLFLLVIFGCSSDSSDGTSVDSSDGTSVPSGAVTITEDNAKEVITAAVVEGGALLDIVDVATAVEVTQAPNVMDIIEIAINTTKNTDFSVVSSTPTGVVFTETCTGGGTVSGDITETESSAVGTVTFTNCVELGVTLNGTLNLNFTWNNATGDYSDTISGTFSGTTSGETVTISGLDYNETGNEFNGEYSLNRYTSSTDFSSGGGFLTQLLQAIVGNDFVQCPRSGIILVTGANNTQAKGTIITGASVLSEVSIEVNDGSGTFTEIPNSPFPCTEIFTTEVDAHASLITFAFEGEVTSSNKEAVFPLGQSISGQYSFDPNVEDENSGNPEQGVYDAIRAFSFTTGTYAVNATPANSANTGGTIIVNRDTVFDPQEYSVFLSRDIYYSDRWGPDVNGEQLVRMWLKLDGGTQAPIDSIELPLTPPDLTAFDSAVFGLMFESDPTNIESFGVQFEVTSLTLVPN